jgi:hypothetical protein
MPIYEFFSPDTNRIYTFYARSLAQVKFVPRCPDDPKARMERLVSKFAVTGSHKEKAESSDEAGFDPRLEKVMAEMEQEMSSMSEESPDPRQLARMMRKMTDATGQKMPDIMQQMIERLEKGEDPEKLEAEYGSSLEDLGEGLIDGNDESGRRVPTRQDPPQRDPTLYEMGDYLPE